MKLLQTIPYKLTELFLLFVVIPVSFAVSFPVWIKISSGLIGFIYVIYILLRIERNTFKIATHLNWRKFFIETVIKLILIAIITIVFVWFTDADRLFEVLVNKPKLWIIILFVYSLFSVYPQELIYRTFFFQRYESLIKNKFLFLFINAILFSLAHLFFKNTLVIILTFFGGILFAFTFSKTKSTVLVSIEHAIYGCWLFTVGMGSMLGFPS